MFVRSFSLNQPNLLNFLRRRRQCFTLLQELYTVQHNTFHSTDVFNTLLPTFLLNTPFQYVLRRDGKFAKSDY
jgi:hypothetical protein